MNIPKPHPPGERRGFLGVLDWMEDTGEKYRGAVAFLGLALGALGIALSMRRRK